MNEKNITPVKKVYDHTKRKFIPVTQALAEAQSKQDGLCDALVDSPELGHDDMFIISFQETKARIEALINML